MYNVINNVLHELFSYSINLTQDKTHLNSMKGDDIGKTRVDLQLKQWRSQSQSFGGGGARSERRRREPF